LTIIGEILPVEGQERYHAVPEHSARAI